MDCLFCKISKKEIESKVLYEDEEFFVFLDIDQSTLGHTLIIPKKHFTDYTKLDSETLSHMFSLADKMSQFLMKKLHAKGISLLFNYGESQIIKHVHLHLLPDFFKNESATTIEEAYRILKDED